MGGRVRLRHLFVLAIFVLAAGRRLLDAAEAASATGAPAAAGLEPVGRPEAPGSGPVSVAAGAGPGAVLGADHPA